ncbi:MAG: acyltransferase [Prevotella sp.]|nr:acyltransferase [Prevotella sp.]
MPYSLKEFIPQLKDLSTFRSELMGWSILWIMALHFRFITLKPLGFIAQYGFSGVEIFMFVSGLGLYYSLRKDDHLTTFYRKRLLRIFPTYYLIGIFASLLLFHDGLLTYFYRYSTIGFWTNGPYFEWYIPSIVMLYLAAPFLKKWLDSRLSSLLVFILAGIMVTAFFLAQLQVLDRAHFFLFYRIPAFVAGMFCAKQLYEGKEASATVKAIYIGITLVGIVVFCLCFPLHHAVYEFKYYALFFLMPVFIAFFCLLSKLSSAVARVISAIGNASLEIYLIQCLFFTAIVNGQLIIPDIWHDAVTFILIASCSATGILLHKLLNRR